MGRAAILRAASDASSPLRGSSPSERSTSGECQRGSGVQATVDGVPLKQAVDAWVEWGVQSYVRLLLGLSLLLLASRLSLAAWSLAGLGGWQYSRGCYLWQSGSTSATAVWRAAFRRSLAPPFSLLSCSSASESLPLEPVAGIGSASVTARSAGRSVVNAVWSLALGVRWHRKGAPVRP